MKKSSCLFVLLFLVICFASLSHQSAIKVKRQVVFPDDNDPEDVDTENRWGGGWGGGRRPRPTRPNNNNNNNRQTTTTPSTTTAAPNPTADPACVAACIKTPEYNPVCASNGESYDNPSRLQCARRCGLGNLSQVRTGRCPPPATN